MKNPINLNDKAKDGTIVRPDNDPALGNENYNSRRPSNGFEAGREMSLKEFLSTKLPRKHITPDIISSIREKILKSDIQ